MWKPVWKDINILKLKEIFFNKLGVLIDRDFKFGVLLLVFVRFLAVIQAIYIEMVFCKESMSVPFSSFPWILASRESGQRIVYFDLEYLSVLCLKVSIYQFCRKQLTKLANLLMHSQCALSGPISSSRKTRKLTVCRFI
jgi:hypothetical protein